MKKRNGLRYCISFDTKEMPGKLVAISVALDKVLVAGDESVRVDLCNHPLYPDLVRYVLSNPPGGRK